MNALFFFVAGIAVVLLVIIILFDLFIGFGEEESLNGTIFMSAFWIIVFVFSLYTFLIKKNFTF